MGQFREWVIRESVDSMLSETDGNRYSIEVNYRTNLREILEHYAKLVLGFVSSGMKNHGFHVKHVYSERPYRVIVSAQNWEDGEWIGIVSYHHHTDKFVISAGYWNKDRKTVSVQVSHDTDDNSASSLVDKMTNFMSDLKKREPRRINKLNPAPMKRGPKR